MYSDPSLIRKHVVKLSLNDREDDLITAYCAYSGEQKAALLRELILSKAAEVMHDINSAGVAAGLQRPK